MVESLSNLDQLNISGADAYIYSSEPVTIEQVRSMGRASDKLFCKLQDNKFLTFGHYIIKDYESKTVLVEIGEDLQTYAHQEAVQREIDGQSTIESRTVMYRFGPQFLELKTLSLRLEFNIVCEEPIKDLLLIERHYFRDRLLINFEFKFPFCMPKSKNDCEFIYDLPNLTEEEKKEMIENPWEVKSDSFFFHEGRLIIHNKAAYSYE
ncbi:gmp-delta subunit family protein [Stylonychia lemnae]|uniref:Gmp-delta subunit family protein n=1 Tax=Stylonychia lemnae TaxID=5949 RepID=A0A078AGT6_STYLE|nr:gmp-delta subunit family protein [Stylonychia lemnae]|eukprot:CDW80742.1 gmp-delta subunit family protein [Stylonychia lemnae]